MLAFYPILVLGPGSLQHNRFEDNIHGTPLALMYAGTFAVAIFFVLSGFVLTIGFFQTKSEKIIKKLASKRYLRLMIPALTVTVLCFILIKIGFPQYIAKAAEITGSGWLASGWNFDASFFNALYSGTIGIFVEGSSPYDNVLWTMLTEFAGSFIVFAFVLLFGSSKHRWMSYIIVGILTFNTWFLPFILGMGLADLHASGHLEYFKKKIWVAGALVGAVLFGSFPVASTSATVYSAMNNQLFTGFTIDYPVFYLTIGATLLIFSVLISARLTAWLEKPNVSNLGKYTFSLYLVHIPVLYTVGVVAFLAAIHHMGYNAAVLTALAISVPTIIITTVLFEKYIDAPAVRFSALVARIFDNDEDLGIRKVYLRVRRKTRKYLNNILRKPSPEELPSE